MALDMDVFSMLHVHKGRYEEWAELARGHDYALAFAVVGEVKGGAMRARWGDHRRAALDVSLRACVVLPTTVDVVNHWAALHAALKDPLKGGGVNDMWVAACCLAYGLPLLTNNLADYQRLAIHAPALRLIHPDLPSPTR